MRLACGCAANSGLSADQMLQETDVYVLKTRLLLQRPLLDCELER